MNDVIVKAQAGNVNRTLKVSVLAYKRFLLYGGARSSADNSAFYFAAKNVTSDYKGDGNISMIAIDSAKQVIDLIGKQKDNSIQSIDFFTHGGVIGLFMIKGASIHKTIAKKQVESKNLNASLYDGYGFKIIGFDKHPESDVISNINYSKFTKNCKIEVHGCSTADSKWLIDNFCENMSEYLYQANKKDSVVIGHTTAANPNINGSTTINEQQDYRHGERAIFNNGKKLLTTNIRGRITAKTINTALSKR